MKIIIVGAGFAGLQLARKLNNKEDVEVLLIDKNNYHQFQPLFYQVATAGLDASNISFPLRKVFHNSKNVSIRLAELQTVNAVSNTITTDIGTLYYDILVLATGADTNFFGNENLKKLAFPMKSTVEALQLKQKLIQNLEDALEAKGDAALTRQLSIVVVGGGATGVEVSGAIAEMRNDILPKDYPDLDFTKMKIYLLENSPEILGAMSDKSSIESKKYLQQLGVEVCNGVALESFDGETVTLRDGGTIATKTVIWSAGIKGNVPQGIDSELIVRGNRIKVDRTSKMFDFENIYILGDVAYMETPKYPKGHPQVANVAINQAKNLAVNILRMVTGNKHFLKEFEYNDKGSMATVGRHLAVVDIPKPNIHFSGFFAWLVWMVLHLMLILGVKNRLQILINWAYKYFTRDQSLRLLFKNYYQKEKMDL
ncbi:MAG: NAD(P)/FAD-dependent oxidoreductase [Pedobacter sp.]|nr:NAD(P)/FAD-dependent oxidoreductase [Chitinophagaceae bacterium]